MNWLQVATVLTVYGIETSSNAIKAYFLKSFELQQYLPFTVLKQSSSICSSNSVLYKLQQYLPFTVLKLAVAGPETNEFFWRLQQYLPFTVLKLLSLHVKCNDVVQRCNSTYRLRY